VSKVVGHNSVSRQQHRQICTHMTCQADAHVRHQQITTQQKHACAGVCLRRHTCWPDASGLQGQRWRQQQSLRLHARPLGVSVYLETQLAHVVLGYRVSHHSAHCDSPGVPWGTAILLPAAAAVETQKRSGSPSRSRGFDRVLAASEVADSAFPSKSRPTIAVRDRSAVSCGPRQFSCLRQLHSSSRSPLSA
jgi:hypothetical protein